MNCSVARKVLYPSPDRCALGVETAPALDHLRQCAECRQYFESHAEWSRLLRDKAGSEPAPEPLRQRVAAMMEQQQRKALGTSRRRRAMVAAAFLLAVAPAAWLALRLHSRLLFQAMCEDHANYLNGSSQFRSSDSAQMESWFSGKTGFGVRVPALENADLVGGRLCWLRGRKAALVFYRRQGRPVSLYQLNAREVSLAALERSEVDGAEMWRASWKGYSLAAFEQRGVVYVLVSDLRESELLQMAAAAQARARGY